LVAAAAIAGRLVRRNPTGLGETQSRILRSGVRIGVIAVRAGGASKVAHRLEHHLAHGVAPHGADGWILLAADRAVGDPAAIGVRVSIEADRLLAVDVGHNAIDAGL